VLCDQLLKDTAARTALPTDIDTKEAFYAQSIRNQVILELVNKPDSELGNILRAR
jgi:hypothetical protein